MLGFYLTPSPQVSITEIARWMFWDRTSPWSLVWFKCRGAMSTAGNRLGFPIITRYEYGVVNVGFLWLPWTIPVWNKRFVPQHKSTSFVAQVRKDLILSPLLAINTLHVTLPTLVRLIVDFHPTLKISYSFLHSVKSVLLSEQLLNIAGVESFWNRECGCTGLLHSRSLVDLSRPWRWVKHMNTWS